MRAASAFHFWRHRQRAKSLLGATWHLKSSSSSEFAATSLHETEPPPFRILESQQPRLAPAMPKPIDDIIQERWSSLDERGLEMLSFMKSHRAFQEFAHGRSPFCQHLRSTWGMLHVWGQPSHVTRCGLFHSIYSGQLFHFKLFNLHDASHRATLRHLVGANAEHLIFEFAASDRQPSMPLVHGRQDRGPPVSDPAPPAHPAPEPPHALASESVRDLLRDALPFSSHADAANGVPVVRFGEPLNPRGYTFAHRGLPGASRHVSAKTLAEVMLVTVADVAEQLTGVSTFIDIYQKETLSTDHPGGGAPEKLWPGNGQPGIGHAFFSNLLFLAAPHLDVVPSVYHNCTTIVREADELAARDAYWRVVTEEPNGSLPPHEQVRLLKLAVRKNPFIAEPQVLLAQLLLHQGEPHAAAHHAAEALSILYAWGTCWDKRRGWEQWVGFARMLHLQAHRKARGMAALPWEPLAPADPASQPQCYLGDLVEEFDDVTEPCTTESDEGAMA